MSWTKTIERYLREGRTVSGGCGPSAAMKSINQNIQAFAGQVQTEAGAVFGAASSVFNNIMNATKGIISGGPSQYGYSAGEQSALTAQAVNAGATEARNLKGAAASEVGAIGGGNTVTPAGIQQATVMSAEQKAAAEPVLPIPNALPQGQDTLSAGPAPAPSVMAAPDMLPATPNATDKLPGHTPIERVDGLWNEIPRLCALAPIAAETAVVRRMPVANGEEITDP